MSEFKTAFAQLKEFSPSADFEVNDLVDSLSLAINTPEATREQRINVLKLVGQFVIDCAELCAAEKKPCDQHMSFLYNNIALIYRQIIDIPPVRRTGLEEYAALGLDTEKMMEINYANTANAANYIFANFNSILEGNDPLIGGTISPLALINEIKGRMETLEEFDRLSFTRADLDALSEPYLPKLSLKGFLGDGIRADVVETAPGRLVKRLHPTAGEVLDGTLNFYVEVQPSQLRPPKRSLGEPSQ